MSVPFVILADDLTGATDTGVKFANRGLITFAVSSSSKEMEFLKIMKMADVLAVYTDTRGVPSGEAYQKIQQVTQTLLGSGIREIYKKVDSTLRGNIGFEIDAILDESNYEGALVAVSSPEQKRVVIGGIHLVEEIPLEETGVAKDPISPVKGSRVSTIIQMQTKRKVSHIDLTFIAKGATVLKKEIEARLRNGSKVITLDSLNEENLDVIARTGQHLSRPLLMVGSAGLANSIAKKFGEKKSARPRKFRTKKSILVLCGSRSQISARQLDRLKEDDNIQTIILSPKAISGREERREMDRVQKSLVCAIGSHKDPVLRFSPGKVVKGKEGEIIHFVGELAFNFINQFKSKVGGMILVGGDTAVHVLKWLGYSFFRIVEEPLPGCPKIKLVGGRLDGLAIISKAGGFGNEETLMKAYKILKGGKEKWE